MAMQYPILFPYGEDGFYIGKPYQTENNTRKRKFLTMREFYAHMMQTRRNQGKIVIMGGRLYCQYIVDAYTVVEEGRLTWVRNNQNNFWVEYYNSLPDAAVKGDNNAASLGE